MKPLNDKGINQLQELDCLKMLVVAFFGTTGAATPTSPPSSGGGVAVTSTTGSNVSVTATSGTALAANTARKSVTIVNYGANPVTLYEGTPAVFASGIYLNAGGGTYNMGADYLYTGIITAICASTLSSTLAVVERQ